MLADLLGIEPYLIPAPTDVARSIGDNTGLLADNAWVTLKEVVAGFGVALLIGVAFAVLLHVSPLLRRAFYPLIIASQTVPIIVIAPILVVWFGFGIGPKVAIIALICFFPITVNTLDGLESVEPAQRKMLRSLGAGRLQILGRLELPASLPYLVSGAKIAIAIAVIGAVFGEWAGRRRGPRPPDAGRQCAARGGPDLRRDLRPLGDGDAPVRRGEPARTTLGLVAANTPERLARPGSMETTRKER